MSSRRSGHQLNVYVCDRFVLPHVHNRITETAEGRFTFDLLTREFIRAELGFRFFAVASPAEAFLIERRLQRGERDLGRSILNPFGLIKSEGFIPGGSDKDKILKRVKKERLKRS